MGHQPQKYKSIIATGYDCFLNWPVAKMRSVDFDIKSAKDDFDIISKSDVQVYSCSLCVAAFQQK